MSLPEQAERSRGASALAFIVLVAIVLGLFSPAVFRKDLLAPFDIMQELAHPWNDGEVGTVYNHFVSDAVLQYLPYRASLQKSYREDGYIGWNDDILGGRPFAHNTMALPYSLSNQLFRVLPFWTAWHVGIMLEFLIAGLGMWFLARQRGATIVLALMVAIAWMLNAQFVAWIYHRWALSAFCWVAWILLFAELAMRAPRRRWLGAAFGAALALALAILGGTLQHIAFVALVMAGYSIGWLFDTARKEPEVSWRRVVPVLVVIAVIGLGLSAIGWMTAVQGYFENDLAHNNDGKLGYTIRSQGGDHITPLKNLASYPLTPFPWPMGVTRGMDYWKLFDTDLLYLNYYGFLPTLLAPLIFFFRTIPWRVRFIFLLGALLPLTPLRGILYNRVNILMIFAGCWIFAEGLSKQLPALFRKIVRWLPAAFGVAVVLWLAVSLMMVQFHEDLLDMLREGVWNSRVSKRFGAEHEWMEGRILRGLQQIRIWDPVNLIAVGTAMLGCLALRRYLRGFGQASGARGPVIAILLGTVLIEGAMGFTRWVSWSPPETANILVEDEEIVRMKNLVGDGLLLTGTDKAPRWKVPFPPNILSKAGVRTLEGFDSIWIPTMWQAAGGGYDPKTAAAVGVTHWLEYEGFDGPGEPWRVVHTGKNYKVYANPDPVPWATVRDEAGALLGEARLVAKTMSTRRIEIPEAMVPAGTSATLRLLENWHDGWSYRVGGGAWRQVERGELGEQVVRLDPAADGAQELALRFRSKTVKAGSMVSLANVVLLLVGLVAASAMAAKSGAAERPGMAVEIG